MEILAEYACAELVIKGSRFIAELLPISGQQDAREVLKQQKQKYADATHVVHAFVTGKNAEVMGMSDDGEPPGTAGRPVLDVLKGRCCTNVLLTVTRYFGGTLLGTGGLVKAYSDAAKAVIAAASFEELIIRMHFVFTIPYQLITPVKRYLASLDTRQIEEIYATDVTVSGFVRLSDVAALRKYLTELTNGQCQIILEEDAQFQ